MPVVAMIRGSAPAREKCAGEFAWTTTAYRLAFRMTHPEWMHLRLCDNLDNPAQLIHLL
jgi:hypothetical protein